MKKKFFLLTICVGLAGSTVALSADLFNRKKYESPRYEVEMSDGAFEVRKYAEMLVASAPMSDRSGNNRAFRNLFDYISGGNESGTKIAMTTPVFTSPKKDGGAGVMSFVVPAEIAKAGAPKADSESVEIKKRKGGKFAVYRYSGRWTEARESKAQARLEEWMAKKGLKAVGQFEKANYDPPFTPGFLRRNEVLVRISN